MALRPQTLYGIADSPIGLAAWMLDHDDASYALIARVFDGEQEGLTRDDILDNVTLYWLTKTAVSSARLYWESKLAFFAPKGVTLPTAVSVFPDEIYAAPRSWAEKAYPNLIHYNRLPKGGHFAAWEQPELFTSGDARVVPIAAMSRRTFVRAAEEGHSIMKRDGTLARRLCTVRPDRLRPFDGATEWLNSQPLTADDLQGQGRRSSTSGPTRASTGSARFRMSAPGPRSIASRAWW